MDQFTLADSDRTIYENIRALLVATNHLPDVTTFTNPQFYQNAKVALKDNLIEVFGVGASESRDEKTTNKIIIDRKGVNVGNLGASSKTIVKSFDAWKEIITPEMSSDIDYDIRIISKSVDIERKMLSILLATFGMRRYIPVVENYNLTNDKMMFVIFRGEVDLSGGDLRESLLKYTIMDVWLSQTMGIEKVVREIPALTSFKFQLSISGIDGTKETKQNVMEIEINREED